MDFEFSHEEEEFRREVEHFFKKEEIVGRAREEWESGEGYGPFCWELLRKLGAKGWLCPTWPREYSGLEVSYIYQYIIMDELLRHTGIWTIAPTMVGPVILRHGSEQQRKEYLPLIARGETEFALGYTEPQAGSDLASLEMRAEDKGDYFLVNGQKMFNTRVHYAQYHWLAARTEVTAAKHRGISLFIVDLKTPGITIRPIWTVGGFRTNEVFYGDVKVAKESLVGEKNRGFYYILEALDYERVTTTSRLKIDFEELVSHLKQKGEGKNLLIQQRLTELAIDIEIADLFALRVVWMLSQNKIPNYEAAMLKALVSETEQRLVNTGMQILGVYGQLKKGSKWAPLGGKFEWRYRDSLESLVTRGTSEIMRNIMAQRGLGLPRA